MTDTNVENTNPLPGEDENQNPKEGDVSQSTPQGTEKREKQAWYEQRKIAKLQKEQEKELNELKAKLERGELKPTDEDVDDILSSKDMRIRELETERFLDNNPAYATHKQAILSAINEPRYQNLTADEVARVVASAPVMEDNARKESIGAHSTGTGYSARDMRKTPPASPQPGTKEMESFIQQIKMGNR